MTAMTVEEAQARLPELLLGLAPGESVSITSDGRPVARITGEAARRPRVAGLAKGMLIVHSEDDEHLADFADYMP